MSEGVNARDLSEDDLRRELAHAKEKAPDIEAAGTPHQQANLKDRTAQLEQEFLRRNPPAGAEDSPQAGSGGDAARDTTDRDTTDRDTTAGDSTDRDATAEGGPDDSAPGAAADSSAPAVTGQPADDPNQPENLT